MAAITTQPRKIILDAIAALGYEPLEATWVHNPLGEGGAWAATFREPGTWAIHHEHAIYLGKLLDKILSYPNLLLGQAGPPMRRMEVDDPDGTGGEGDDA